MEDPGLLSLSTAEHVCDNLIRTLDPNASTIQSLSMLVFRLAFFDLECLFLIDIFFNFCNSQLSLTAECTLVLQ